MTRRIILDQILDDGFEFIDQASTNDLDIYGMGNERIIYDNSKDVIVCTYTMVNKESPDI